RLAGRAVFRHALDDALQDAEVRLHGRRGVFQRRIVELGGHHFTHEESDDGSTPALSPSALPNASRLSRLWTGRCSSTLGSSARMPWAFGSKPSQRRSGLSQM